MTARDLPYLLDVPQHGPLAVRGQARSRCGCRDRGRTLVARTLADGSTPALPIVTKRRLESVALGAARWACRHNGQRDLRDRRYNIDIGRYLTVCDGNYLRLTKLMPNLGRHAEDVGFAGDRRAFRVLVGAASPAVTIEVLECGRYTTVLALSQLSAARGIAELNIKVRVYHDARSAEVIEFQGQRRFDAVHAYPNAAGRQADEKAQVNRFLSEFLNACLRHGLAAEQPVGDRMAATARKKETVGY